MVNVHFIYALLIRGQCTQKMMIFTTFYYNAFPIHVPIYAIVNRLRLHVSKFCKRLPAKNKTLPFTSVIVSPLRMSFHVPLFSQKYRRL